MGRCIVPDALQARLAALYSNGYRWLIEFDPKSNITPLAVKKLTSIGPLIRDHYPTESYWCAWEFGRDGRRVHKARL